MVGLQSCPLACRGDDREGQQNLESNVRPVLPPLSNPIPRIRIMWSRTPQRAHEVINTAMCWAISRPTDQPVSTQLEDNGNRKHPVHTKELAISGARASSTMMMKMAFCAGSSRRIKMLPVTTNNGRALTLIVTAPTPGQRVRSVVLAQRAPDNSKR